MAANALLGNLRGEKGRGKGANPTKKKKKKKKKPAPAPQEDKQQGGPSLPNLPSVQQ